MVAATNGVLVETRLEAQDDVLDEDAEEVESSDGEDGEDE